MDFNQIIKFSFKNAFRRKSVAILAILGVTVAISLQISMSAMSDGIDSSFDSVVNEAVGRVQIAQTDVILSQSQVSQNVIDTIESSVYYFDVNTILSSVILPSTLLLSYLVDSTFQSANQGNGFDLSITGIDLNPYLEVNSDLSELTTGSEYFQENLELIISDSLYELDKDQFAIGNNIDFTINSTYSVSGLITGIVVEEDSGVLRRGNTRESYSIWMSIESAQLLKFMILQDESVAIDSARFLHYESQGVNSANFDVLAFNSLTLDTTFTNFNAVNNFIIDMEDFLNSELTGSYEVFSEATFLSNVGASQNSIQIFLEFIGYIALFTGIISIIISQMVGIESRIREFAVMKAVGWKNIHITTEVIIESSILGIIGSIFGYIFSKVFILYLNKILVGRLGQSTGTINFTFDVFLNSLYLALIIGVIGGLYPSYMAQKVDPIAALNRG
ncbi:MAG: ABC transporter permease [Candidatus Kariarchaeaceae archaeon]|jgi:putative ABC transport system permease protein